jgi:hypothetical protein
MALHWVVPMDLPKAGPTAVLWVHH